MLLYIQPADLSSSAELLFENERSVSLLDPSPDGRCLLYAEQGQGPFSYDMESGESTTLIEGRYIASARFHPSGEWIVYPDPRMPSRGSGRDPTVDPPPVR